MIKMDDDNTYLIKSIVFDYDGTLCEFQIPFLKMRQELLDFLNPTLKLPDNYLSLEDRMTIIGRKTRDFLTKNKRQHEWKSIKEEMEIIIKKWEWDSAKKNEIYPFVMELLKYFKKLNLKLGIFTLEPKEIIDFLLEKHEIKPFFYSIVARDDVINTKPHSEHLMRVLDELNSDPKNTLVVGDHPVDMQCANNIGAISAAVLNDRHQKGEFNDYKVDFFLKDVAEIRELFEKKVLKVWKFEH